MIPELTRHLALLLVSIHIPAANSLKEKRFVLRGLKERLRNEFNVSLAELDGQDKWQVSTFGLALVHRDRREIDRIVEHILSFLDRHGDFYVCDHVVEFY